MTSTILSVSEMEAVQASKTLAEKHIIGMPVVKGMRWWATSQPMRS